MKKYFILTIFLWCSMAVAVHAASLTLNAPSTAAVGEQFTVDVIADTDNTPINSVEASIGYPSDKLEFAGYQENSGVIKLWIAEPKAVSGVVNFAGGIPGGATKNTDSDSNELTIVRLLFVPKEAGDMAFTISRSTVLKNDGKGSALTHSTAGTHIVVSGDTAPATADTTPPEPFTLNYIPQDGANNTPALIAFHTTDRESGIKTYRVKVWWGRWHDASSPYSVQACLFGCTVSVQAIDSAGNVQTAKQSVPGIVPWWGVLVLLVVVVAGFRLYFVVQRKI